MMSTQATLGQFNIEQALEQILASQQITPKQQRWLISLCLNQTLSAQQEHLVNKVYEALRQGVIVIVDTRNKL